jgi:hypothetical protein
MKINVFFFALLILVNMISCKSTTSKNGQRELIPNPEKYEHDKYVQIADSLKPVFHPDTVIGKIRLNSIENISDYLGADIMDRLTDSGLPAAEVLSEDKKQRLKVYFHPGGMKNEFSEFEISYNKKIDRGEPRATDDKEFITESNIKLGITVGDLKSIKGEPDSIISTNKTIIYHYKIDDFDSSDFLKRYNMPIYFADYEFKNGYLIKFKFGFEYP